MTRVVRVVGHTPLFFYIVGAGLAAWALLSILAWCIVIREVAVVRWPEELAPTPLTVPAGSGRGRCLRPVTPCDIVVYRRPQLGMPFGFLPESAFGFAGILN